MSSPATDPAKIGSPEGTVARTLAQFEQLKAQSNQPQAKTAVNITKDKVNELRKNFLEELKQTPNQITHVKKGTTKIVKDYVEKLNAINNNSDEESLKVTKRTTIQADYTGQLEKAGFTHVQATAYLTLAEQSFIVSVTETDDNKASEGTIAYDSAAHAALLETSSSIPHPITITNTSYMMGIGHRSDLTPVPEATISARTGSPDVLAMSMLIEQAPGSTDNQSRAPDSSMTAQHGSHPPSPSGTGDPDIVTRMMGPTADSVSPTNHQARMDGSSMQATLGSPHHSPAPTPPQTSPRPVSPSFSESGTVVDRDDGYSSETDTIAADGDPEHKKTATQDHATTTAMNGTDTHTDEVVAATAELQKLTITDKATQTRQLASTIERVRKISTRDKFVYGFAAAGIGMLAIVAFAPRHCNELMGKYCMS